MDDILNDLKGFINSESGEKCVVCGKMGAGIGVLVEIDGKFRVYAVDCDECGDKVYNADRKTLDTMKYGSDPFEFEVEK